MQIKEDMGNGLRHREVVDEILTNLKKPSVSSMVSTIMELFHRARSKNDFCKELESLAERNPLNFVAAMKICELKGVSYKGLHEKVELNLRTCSHGFLTNGYNPYSY